MRRCALIGAAVVVVGGAIVAAASGQPVAGPTRPAGAAGEPPREADSRVLRPKRSIKLEEGKAPQYVRFSSTSGRAYLACIGRRTRLAPPPGQARLSPAEVQVIDPKTGRLLERLPVDDLNYADLSESGRYLVTTAFPRTDLRKIIRVYDESDLTREVLSVTLPHPSGDVCVDNTGTVYLTRMVDRQLERVGANTRSAVTLDGMPRDICLGPGGGLLYVSLSHWGAGSADTNGRSEAGARIAVFASDTLRDVQVLSLKGRLVVGYMRLWRIGASLVFLSDGAPCHLVPVAASGELGAPQTTIELPETLYGFGEPAIDERRSIAYFSAMDERDRTAILLVDLAHRNVIGSVIVSDECWEQPHLAVRSDADEIWLVTTDLDAVLIYDVAELLRRARKSGAASAIARPRGSGN